ncbi:MAG TPA: hypothetical protein VGK14_11685, partial [Novimethylophilus sp.]|uniref:hypothetical protein n=1 Tax=Novimethylophilus sp. TaxID=2137426 RepID=UPI002F40AE2C
QKRSSHAFGPWQSHNGKLGSGFLSNPKSVEYHLRNTHCSSRLKAVTLFTPAISIDLRKSSNHSVGIAEHCFLAFPSNFGENAPAAELCFHHILTHIQPSSVKSISLLFLSLLTTTINWSVVQPISAAAILQTI